jgi:hypothetical protein
VIRGILILAAGFSLGYVKAMHDSEENFQALKDLAENVQELLVELKKPRVDVEGKTKDFGDISAEDMPKQGPNGVDSSDAT